MIQTQKKQISKSKSIQAPVGGLNARDAVANMKETEATIMVNWFPTPAEVVIRNGMASHATGMSGAIDTLAAYNFGTTQELYGIVGGEIYNVTASGAVGAAVVTGLTNSRFQHATIGTAGGNFLMMVNGADKLQGYNGSAWWEDGDGTHDITGFNTANAININNFKNRIWLIEKNTMRAWYLPSVSIAGAANSLDLSTIFKLGGSLVAMANWTIDNAAGIDDYAAFITSEGEIAIYQGTDPSSATTWALKGTFRAGKPIGNRCTLKVAADVLLLTTDGAFPLSKALLTDRSQLQGAITDKIVNLFNRDVQSHSSNFGWQSILHPIGTKILVNVPSIESTTSHQYVLNTTNGSWTKFTGWNAFCFEEMNDVLYYGGDSVVYKADTGTSDGGANIETDVQQAFSYFGSPGQQKQFVLARPLFLTEGNVSPAIVLNVDFEQKLPSGSPSFTANSNALWDVSDWDTTAWASGDTIQKNWQSVSGVGYSAGIRITTASKDITLKWQATDIVYKMGGVL